MEKSCLPKRHLGSYVGSVIQHLRLASGMYGKVDLESYIGLANKVVIFRDFVNANSLQAIFLYWPVGVAGQDFRKNLGTYIVHNVLNRT